MPDAPLVVLPGNPELVAAEKFEAYVDQILAALYRQLVQPAPIAAAGVRS